LPWATAKVTDGPKPARRRLLDQEDRPATPPVKATVPSFKHQENKRFLMKRALLALALATVCTQVHADTIAPYWASTHEIAVCEQNHEGRTDLPCTTQILYKREILLLDLAQVSVPGQPDVIALVKPLCPGVDHGCSPFAVLVYVRMRDFNEFFKPAQRPTWWKW
jgi:hypothetical protein